MRTLACTVLLLAACSASTPGPATDGGQLDAARSDAGSSSPDSGGSDASQTDAGTITPTPDSGSATACTALTICCPYITSVPEFHDGCVAAAGGTNEQSCMNQLDQDCCMGALTPCCDAISAIGTRTTCMEITTAHDGSLCAGALSTYCPAP